MLRDHLYIPVGVLRVSCARRHGFETTCALLIRYFGHAVPIFAARSLSAVLARISIWPTVKTASPRGVCVSGLLALWNVQLCMIILGAY